MFLPNKKPLRMNFYRPRGVLARSIYEKFHNDQVLDKFDTKLWYSLNQELPPYYQSKFYPLIQPDEVTMQWLEQAKMLSANIWLHMWHAIARVFLQFFMTQTDINGFLNRGSMFILSENQFSELLQAGGFNMNAQDTVNFLDIGAGDGRISVRLLNLLATVKDCANATVYAFATETSWTMRKRLKNLNFTVLDSINEINNVDLISCLNVLDRCTDPFELLRDVHSALAPEGRAIIALVLPYMHYVEHNKSHLPTQPLMKHWPKNAKKLSFETEATVFFELVESLGFKVETWTKAPYLCEGDLRQSFYWLVDLVVILSKKKNEANSLK